MIEKYKNWLLVNGASTLTITSYIGKLKTFLKAVKVSEITEEKIVSFLLKLQDEHKPSTINHYKAVIKSFLNFLKKDIKLPKDLVIDKKIPDSISEEYFIKEVIPVVECIFINPLKIKAIMYFMFYSGVRLGEIENLKREDIDLNSRTAKIFGKRKKERMVVFNKPTSAILSSYFISEAETINAFNIRREGLRQVFRTSKEYFKNISFRPHLLRHSFATMLSNKGVNSTTLQRLMGHEDIKTTQKYIGANTKELKIVYDRAMGGK